MIICKGCQKEFDAEQVNPTATVRVNIAGGCEELALFACPVCGVLMTRDHGAVTLEFDPMTFARYDDLLRGLNPTIRRGSMGVKLDLEPAKPAKRDMEICECCDRHVGKLEWAVDARKVCVTCERFVGEEFEAMWKRVRVRSLKEGE